MVLSKRDPHAILGHLTFMVTLTVVALVVLKVLDVTQLVDVHESSIASGVAGLMSGAVGVFVAIPAANFVHRRTHG